MLKSLLLFIILIFVFFIAIIGFVVFKAMALVRSLKKGGKGNKQTSEYSNGSYRVIAPQTLLLARPSLTLATLRQQTGRLFQATRVSM